MAFRNSGASDFGLTLGLGGYKDKKSIGKSWIQAWASKFCGLAF